MRDECDECAHAASDQERRNARRVEGASGRGRVHEGNNIDRHPHSWSSESKEPASAAAQKMRLYCRIRGLNPAREYRFVATEAEHRESDQGVGGSEAERDAGDESDLGIHC